MIVQIAGLPGTGKTTLADGLHRHFGRRCLILSKDLVRQALYGPSGQVTYERGQDDFVISLLHLAAREHLARRPKTVVILERTCTRSYQIDDVTRLAADLGQPLAILWCWCPDDVARARLAADHAAAGHPATNRTPELYLQLQQTAEPITGPALPVRTDRPPADVIADAVAYLDQVHVPAEETIR
jgi:predicted kinase